jgi:hypothetical protein
VIARVRTAGSRLRMCMLIPAAHSTPRARARVGGSAVQDRHTCGAKIDLQNARRTRAGLIRAMAPKRIRAGVPLAACAAVFALLLAAAPTSRACDNEAEKRVLLDTKLLWDSEKKALASWNDGSCPCLSRRQQQAAAESDSPSSTSTPTWRGISCEDGRVTEINLLETLAGSLAGAWLRAAGGCGAGRQESDCYSWLMRAADPPQARSRPRGASCAASRPSSWTSRVGRGCGRAPCARSAAPARQLGCSLRPALACCCIHGSTPQAGAEWQHTLLLTGHAPAVPQATVGAS